MSPEARLQAACFEWFRYQYPKLKHLFFAIPNGGSRNKIEALNLKKQGVTPGVPDTFLAVPKRPYSGLWIEFKHGSNTTTDEQARFLNLASSVGYATAVIYSVDEFMTLVTNYLNRPNETP